MYFYKNYINKKTLITAGIVRRNKCFFIDMLC
jgi:hypothetical protein